MTRPTRVGLFMYTPRLGGAEGYLRDLLHGLDSELFEASLFAPSWHAFDQFMGVADLPTLRRVPVRVLEPGTSIRAGGPEADSGAHGAEAPSSLTRRLARGALDNASVREPARVAMHSIYWRANVRAVERALLAHPVDVLHVVNGGYPGAGSARAAVLAGARAGVPAAMMTVCSTAGPRRLRPLEGRIDRAVDANLRAVVVPAQRPLDALVHLRGFDSRKVHVIPWGVPAPDPQSEPGARARARRKLGLPADAIVVASIGNFTPQKGQSDVVRAMNLLVAENPDLHVVLAGAGPEHSAVTDLVRDLGLQRVVSLPGRIEDRFGLLRAADLFVLASEIEGLPLVVLEALSQGCPVVATDVGGMPEAVIDGETGWLVPAGDVHALAATLGRAIADESGHERLRERARAIYLRRFTLESMLGAHVELYEQLALAG